MRGSESVGPLFVLVRYCSRLFPATSTQGLVLIQTLAPSLYFFFFAIISTAASGLSFALQEPICSIHPEQICEMTTSMSGLSRSVAKVIKAMNVCSPLFVSAANSVQVSDGAGVKMKRVIGAAVDYVDPFLLLDEFRSDSVGHTLSFFRTITNCNFIHFFFPPIVYISFMICRLPITLLDFLTILTEDLRYALTYICTYFIQSHSVFHFLV